jgi:hypothetical protein
MSVTVRPLTKADLPEAQRIVRRAFGTFLGASDLDTFWTDFDYVYGRCGAEHVASFAAELDGELVGSNFATRWGSVPRARSISGCTRNSASTRAI